MKICIYLNESRQIYLTLGLTLDCKSLKDLKR